MSIEEEHAEDMKTFMLFVGKKQELRIAWI